MNSISTVLYGLDGLRRHKCTIRGQRCLGVTYRDVQSVQNGPKTQMQEKHAKMLKKKKKNEKKMKKLLISALKSVQLYPTKHIMETKHERVTWGCP